MTVVLSHPHGLLRQSDYAPVAVGTGSRLLLMAGQVGADADDRPASRDLAGQIHAALHDVVIGVEGAGGTVRDVARLTFFVVGWTPDLRDALFDGIGRAQASDGFPAPMPPITVIGVQALFTPDWLVEIEATAILD